MKILATYNRHFMWFEVAFAGLLTGLAVYLKSTRFLPEKPEAMYTALVASFGALLGFAITGVSVILAFTGSERLELLRRSRFYSLIFDVFISASRFLGLGFISAFIGMISSPDSKFGVAAAYVTFFAFVASVLRLSRCIWVLNGVVRIVTAKPGTNSQSTKGGSQ